MMRESRKTTVEHTNDILDAMRIRQEIDAEISDLYEDRSINDCARFILPHIKSNSTILDCGCGPGKLAVQFADLTPNGHVTGIDANQRHVDLANDLAVKHRINHTTFQHGDLYQLPFADNTFDIAFTHTVLCNLHDPVSALKEINRVVKPGGIIGSREPDYYSSIIYPENPNIFKGLGALAKIQTGYSDSTIGRKLRRYFNEAGITQNQVSASCDYYSSEAELKKIAHYLKSQLMAPDVFASMLEKGIATKDDVQDFCHAMDELASSPDATYAYTLIELTGIKSA